MIKNLINLKNKLNNYKLFSFASKVNEVLRGILPSFEWLNKCRLFMQLNDSIKEEFLDTNSDILSQFDVIKYLGSGYYGDVWELEDNKILKIFSKKEDYYFYKNLQNNIYEGKSNLNFPMIYEINQFNNFEIYYVILEKVSTFSKMINEYIKNNYEKIDLHDKNKGELNEDEYLIPFDLIPEDMIQKYYKFIKNNDYDQFISNYLHTMMNKIIELIIKIKKDIEEDNYQDEEDNYQDEEDNYQDEESLIYRIRTSLLNNEDLPHGFEKQIKNMLGLNNDWLNELIKSTLKSIKESRLDLHSENFGFRSKNIVYFDG